MLWLTLLRSTPRGSGSDSSSSIAPCHERLAHVESSKGKHGICVLWRAAWSRRANCAGADATVCRHVETKLAETIANRLRCRRESTAGHGMATSRASCHFFTPISRLKSAWGEPSHALPANATTTCQQRSRAVDKQAAGNAQLMRGVIGITKGTGEASARLALSWRRFPVHYCFQRSPKSSDATECVRALKRQQRV
jgi:hypothetical protein